MLNKTVVELTTLCQHFSLPVSLDGIADKIIDRFKGIASRVVMYLAAEIIARSPTSIGKWGEIARTVAH